VPFLFFYIPWKALGTSSNNTANKKDQGKENSGGSGFFSFLGSSVEAITATLSSQSEPDQWFDAKKNYVLGLEKQLTALLRATSSLIVKQKGKLWTTVVSFLKNWTWFIKNSVLLLLFSQVLKQSTLNGFPTPSIRWRLSIPKLQLWTKIW
jgi:hypothetical protein